MLVTCRPNTSGRSRGATAWDWGCATACKASPQDDRWNVTLLYKPVECGDIRVQHGLEPVELHLQLGRQLVEHLDRLCRRGGLGARHDTRERRDLVVQSDRIIERILARAVLHLIDRLLDRGEPSLDRVGLLGDAPPGITGEATGTPGGAIELLAYFTDPPYGIVRGAHAARDLHEQVELALII